MKRNIFIFLLIPILSFSQSKGYFDISKDAFYHEKMSEWKKGVYDDFDCKFNTIVDNDSVFKFSAQGYFFKNNTN